MAVIASITKYTKTKYFLSPSMPMGRIKMIFNDSLCGVLGSVLLKSIPVNSASLKEDTLLF